MKNLKKRKNLFKTQMPKLKQTLRVLIVKLSVVKICLRKMVAATQLEEVECVEQTKVCFGASALLAPMASLKKVKMTPTIDKSQK